MNAIDLIFYFYVILVSILAFNMEITYGKRPLIEICLKIIVKVTSLFAMIYSVNILLSYFK